MIKYLFRIGFAPFCNARLFHIFAIIIALIEAYTESVLDTVFYIFLYPAYGELSETSVPYLVAYLLPTKPVRRLIVIIYIPVVCLWHAGRKVQRQTETCDVVEHLADVDCLLPQQLQQKQQQKQQTPIHNRWSCFSGPLKLLQRLLKEFCLYHEYVVSSLRFACQRLPSPQQCLKGLWNVCDPALWKRHLGSVHRPSINCHDGTSRTWKPECSGLDLPHDEEDECKQSTRGPLPYSSRSYSSLSWGELVHQCDEKYQSVLKHYCKRFTFYRFLPLKAISSLWGRFNQLLLPVWLRRPAVRLYIWVFGCCLEDALVQDLTRYKNLCEFFQRSLRPGIRPIDGDSEIVSPVDGTILYFGPVKNGVLEQVKGVTYSLKGFLGPLDKLLLSSGNIPSLNENVPESYQDYMETKDVLTEYLGSLHLDDLNYHQKLLTTDSNQLYQCIIYLAPGDYHRFHSPTDWTVFGRRHFPGQLFSVNPGFAQWLQGLFNFNERALYVGRWKCGFFSMTAVGATNVGSIEVKFDKNLSTNVQSASELGKFHDAVFDSKVQNGVSLRKGEDFGTFNLGSTIVLLFEAPTAFEFHIGTGRKIKYGQGIGCCP